MSMVATAQIVLFSNVLSCVKFCTRYVFNFTPVTAFRLINTTNLPTVFVVILL